MQILTKKDGKLENTLGFLQALETLPDGKYILKKYNRTRTTDQNSYLRGLYQLIAEYMGEEYDTEYVHGVMGMKFLKDNSRKLPYIKSTANLSTVEFSQYIENIRNWMAEFGLILPDADNRKTLYDNN